jgi:hypothetical protein
MQLPWYKSTTAIIGALVISVLFILKAYASYASVQEQELTKNRIDSLHTTKPILERSPNSVSSSYAVLFNASQTDVSIKQQARDILMNERADQKQRKLAQLYLASFESE